MSSAVPSDVACPNCVRPGDAQSGTPSGTLKQIGGVECYVVGSNPDTTILHSVDVFGHKFLGHQLTADALSQKTGFTVVIPNILNDVMDPVNPDFSKFMEWLGRNSVENATSIATKVADALKSTSKKVYGTGFCYGCRIIVNLLEAKKLDGAALYHPTFLKVEDAPLLKETGYPLRFNCATKEHIFVGEVRSTFEKTLPKEQAVFVDYPGAHGFGARPEGEEEKQSSAKCSDDTAAWFKTLKQ